MSQKMYQVHVAYEYIVDGQRLASGTVAFTMDEMSKSRSEMTDIAREFPVGEKVPVYFNPVNPTEACLEKVFRTPHFRWPLVHRFSNLLEKVHFQHSELASVEKLFGRT